MIITLTIKQMEFHIYFTSRILRTADSTCIFFHYI